MIAFEDAVEFVEFLGVLIIAGIVLVIVNQYFGLWATLAIFWILCGMFYKGMKG